MKTSVKQQQQQILYNFTDVLRHGEAKIITENQRNRSKVNSRTRFGGSENNEREEKTK